MLEMARTAAVAKPCYASRLREASCGPLMAAQIRARLRHRMLADAYASLAHAGFRGSRMHMRILVVVRLLQSPVVIRRRFTSALAASALFMKPRNVAGTAPVRGVVATHMSYKPLS